MLNIFLGEFLGTMFLILLGNGVVANVLYKKTKGTKGGIIAIASGWGMAVFIGVIIANAFKTGGHLNPAVTLTFWVKGDYGIQKAMVYFGSELLGATLGQILVSTFYWQHAQNIANKESVIATHCTSPTHPGKTLNNLFSEFVATAVLVSAALVLTISFKANNDNAAMKQIINFAGPLTMGLVVFAIGLSLGGTTGYAINPARDLMPRIVYQLTPYKNKVSADWNYAWIPVVAPLAAGIVVGAFGRII